jgi:hypothetical protein
MTRPNRVGRRRRRSKAISALTAPGGASKKLKSVRIGTSAGGVHPKPQNSPSRRRRATSAPLGDPPSHPSSAPSATRRFQQPNNFAKYAPSYAAANICSMRLKSRMATVRMYGRMSTTVTMGFCATYLLTDSRTE